MGLRDNLSDVSSDLAKILKQLKDIQVAQTGINNGASAYAKAVNAVVGASGGGGNGGDDGSRSSNGTPRPNFSTPPGGGSGSNGNSGGSGGSSGGGSGGSGDSGGGGTFSTPPPPPGTTPSITTARSQRTVDTGSENAPTNAGWGRAAAMTGAAAVTFGYSATPSVSDVYAHQRLKYRASFLSAGGYDKNYYERTRSIFGEMQTDPYGMMTAANIATMTGQGEGTGNFSRVMRETAVTSAVFGMDNASSAVAQAGMNSGSFAGRMAKYGVFVSDMDTGAAKGLGSLVDQIWRVHYGMDNRKISYESVAASIRGGALGLFLNKNFSDVPELREQVTQALLLKAKANGDRLDYSDLGPYGGRNTTQMSGAPGTKSVMGVAVENGLTPENDPGLPTGVLQGTRSEVMDGTADALLEGWRATAYTAANMNELIADITSSGNEFVDFLLNLKGGLQGLQGIGELNPILGLLTGGPMGALKALLPFAGGGDIDQHVGTSTSDSIPARLSRGEYVINARAAQQIGKDRLDDMNATGHPFGSGFASPAQFFSGGGQVGTDEPGYTKPSILGTRPSTNGDGTVTANEATLDRWSALFYGDTNLKPFSVAGSSLNLTLLERDGIGQYMADFAAAWQADASLGQKRLNLNDGSSDAHEPRTTGHGGVSNHAAGVAMDLRYDIISAHDGDTWQTDDTENAAIRRLLQRFSKMEWGGDWTNGDLDEMHFEIRSPRVWGRGGTPGDETTTGATVTPDAAPVTETPGRVFGGAGMSGVRSAGMGQRPSVTSVSPFSGGAKGLNLGMGSTFSYLSKASRALGIITGSSGSGGQSSGPSTDTAEDPGKPVPPGPVVDPGTGSGPKWLFDFLASNGLRGDQLKTAWTIGMRESSGEPSLIANIGTTPPNFRYPDVPETVNFDPTKELGYNGSRYDVGLFQINSQHIDLVKSILGGDMTSAVDPKNNFTMLKQLSNGFTRWTPWGITGADEGGLDYIDWASWDKDGSNAWESNWGPATEQRDAGYLSDYDTYNTMGYSEGAYRTHEGVAKLHEGEMVLPATVAEQFREIMRGASSPGGGGNRDVNITLKIERASDAEAERFARKVKQLMEDDEWSKSVRKA